MKYILLIVLLFSCQSSDKNANVELGQSFVLSMGEEQELADQSLTIRFDDVLEDSRCPKGANCPWAGNAKVRFLVNQDTIALNTFKEPQAMKLPSYLITLESLSPYPKVDSSISKSDYKATIRVDSVMSSSQ